MVSLAMVALGGRLFVPLWRRGSSVGTLSLALLGAVVAFMGGSSLPWSPEGDMEALVIASGFAAIAVSAYVSKALVVRRQDRGVDAGAAPASRDPGWPWSELQRILLVVGLLRPTKTAREPLIALRLTFLALVTSLLLCWVALSFLTRDPNAGSGTEAAIAIVVASALVSAFALIVGTRLERRVVTADGDALVNTYRMVFFLRIGLTEVGPLLGFAGTFFTGGWVYPAALACSIPAWIALAPSTRNLNRIDETRRREGRVPSLFERLLEQPTEPNGA